MITIKRFGCGVSVSIKSLLTVLERDEAFELLEKLRHTLAELHREPSSDSVGQEVWTEEEIANVKKEAKELGEVLGVPCPSEASACAYADAHGTDAALCACLPEQRTNDAVKAVRCRKCGRVEVTGGPTQKYCGDGSDKDNSHEWESVSVQRPSRGDAAGDREA